MPTFIAMAPGRLDSGVQAGRGVSDGAARFGFAFPSSAGGGAAGSAAAAAAASLLLLLARQPAPAEEQRPPLSAVAPAPPRAPNKDGAADRKPSNDRSMVTSSRPLAISVEVSKPL
jgi:hypothetical protein